jgi:hypothetical protein
MFLQHPFHLQPRQSHFGQKQTFFDSHTLAPTTSDPAGHVIGACTEHPSLKSHDFNTGVPSGTRQFVGEGSEMRHTPPSVATSDAPPNASVSFACGAHVTMSSFRHPAATMRSAGHCRSTSTPNGARVAARGRARSVPFTSSPAASASASATVVADVRVEDRRAPSRTSAVRSSTTRIAVVDQWGGVGLMSQHPLGRP